MCEFCQMTWTLQNLISSQKIPNFRSSKGQNKKCFHIRELQMRKLFPWHYVFTHIWYLKQEPKWALPKIYARCDEIMRRDELGDLTVRYIMRREHSWRGADISCGRRYFMDADISWAQIFHGREYFMGANISWARIFHGCEYFDVGEYFVCKLLL